MEKLRRFVVLPIAALVLAACQSGTADITNVVCVGEATTYLDWLNGDLVLADPDPIEEADEAGDLLETVLERGTLLISTDANYEPQSFLQPDGTFVGFDIDVGTEIAERLGVEAEFMHVDWDAITAGNWSGRWDISVGSMTITEPRLPILSFTRPYYYAPAYMGASERSGVESLDDLDFELPDGAEATTLTTDANCVEAIEAGRTEFDLFMTTGSVIDGAAEAGSPVVKIGEPVFTEDLAVALDKSGQEHAALLYEIDRIIGEMHEDGTLTELSEEWFDADLTQDPSGS
jgi:polar amino acid transport system substrate-binding protein